MVITCEVMFDGGNEDLLNLINEALNKKHNKANIYISDHMIITIDPFQAGFDNGEALDIIRKVLMDLDEFGDLKDVFSKFNYIECRIDLDGFGYTKWLGLDEFRLY